MTRRLLDWFDDRTGCRAFLHEALYERIPGGARWRYVWGSTLVFLFFVQVITGVVLWMAYSPSTRTAWESVYYLQHEMTLGWLLRGIHHYAAQAMVVLLVLHLVQVVVDGAYRAPREVNFWLGLILMQLVLALGLTGYLLPWDQKGYYATQVATEIMGSTPVIGPAMQKLVQGGAEYGHHTLTRFFALHAGVLPGLLVFFLVLHVALFRRHSVTAARPVPPRRPGLAAALGLLFGPVGLLYCSVPAALLVFFGGAGVVAALRELSTLSLEVVTLTVAVAANLLSAVLGWFCARRFRRSEEDSTFWPDQVLMDSVACLAVLAAVLGLSVWKGIELTAPANPAEAYSAARPEWYYLFLFRFLKFEWVSHAGEVTGLGEAFGSVVIPGALLLVLVLRPLLGRWRIGHLFNVCFLFLLLAGAGGLTGLALYEDWWAATPEGRDFRAAVHQARVEGERTIELARSPAGIPPEGAIELLRSDPLTQGPRVFEMACITCHQPDDSPRQFDVPPQAPGLADPDQPRRTAFADREWIRSVLTHFTDHFQSLSNITVENGASAARAEAAAYILEGDMAIWSEDNSEILQHPDNADDFTALIEFLYAQTGRTDALPPDDETVQRGRQIFIDGELTHEGIEACSYCHLLVPRGEDQPLSTEDDRYVDGPDLTGYGGGDWLVRFIRDPGAFYGENNAMPAFAGQLSEMELQLVARWLAGDYYSAEP